MPSASAVRGLVLLQHLRRMERHPMSELPESLKFVAMRMPKHPTAREALWIWFYTKTAWFGRWLLKDAYVNDIESRDDWRTTLGFRWSLRARKPVYSISTFGSLDNRGWMELIGVRPEIQTHFLE